MARITYQDQHITEYDDGTEEVRFTAEEWAVMLTDPAFGYVCDNGHRLTEGDHRYGACTTCEHEAEFAYEMYLDEDDRVKDFLGEEEPPEHVIESWRSQYETEEPF